MDSEEIDEKIKPSIITYCHMADEATYKAETDALEREAEAISKLDPEIIENQRKLVEFLTKVKAIQSRQTLEKAQAALKIPDKLKEVYQNNANVLLELCYPLLNIFDVYKLTI